MIKISDDLYLDSDINNYIVKRKKISKKDGSEYYEILGYYGTLKDCLKGLREFMFRMRITESENNISDFMRYVVSTNDELSKLFESLL